MSSLVAQEANGFLCYGQTVVSSGLSTFISGNLIVGARFPRPIAKSYIRNFRRDKAVEQSNQQMLVKSN